MTKNPETFEEAVQIVTDELRDLIIKKHKDYGTANVDEVGEAGCLVRVNEKVARLRNLYAQGKKPVNESIYNSWEDIAGYAIVVLLLRKGLFAMPMEGE